MSKSSHHFVSNVSRSFARPFAAQSFTAQSSAKEGKTMKKIATPVLFLTAAITLASCSTGPSTANTAPVASFTVTPTSGSSPLVVTVNGSASSDPDTGDSIASYDWDWGDSSAHSATATPAAHTYTNTSTTAQNFTITLKVTDTHGATNTKTATVTVSPVAADACAGANAGNCFITVTGTPASALTSATFTVTDPDNNVQNNVALVAGKLPITKEGTWKVVPNAPAGYTVASAVQTFVISASNKTPSVNFVYTAVAPTIVSVTPANNATCVKVPSQLVIVFDQPMNTTTATGFFTNISGGVSVSAINWSTDGKTMTADLGGTAYAPSLVNTASSANAYTFKVTNNGLTGQNGVTLNTAGVTNTFKTCVQRTNIAVPLSAAGEQYNLFLHTTGSAYTPVPGTFEIGRSSGNPIGAFLSFDLSVLSTALQASNITAAEVSLTHSSAVGNPFTTLGLGADKLELYSDYYGGSSGILSPDRAMSFLQPTNKVTNAMTGTPMVGPYKADVLAAFKADVTARTAQMNRSQYQVRFANISQVTSGNLNDRLRVTNAPTLLISYLNED